MLIFAIYTAKNFPYTYITMEGDDFWVLTKDFWRLKLADTPAVTTWLADYLMQFFYSPYIAAYIEALILGAIGILAYSLPLTLSPRKGKSFAAFSPSPRRGGWGVRLLFGLLPPIILGFFCTFSLTFHLQCLFFFILLLVYQLIPGFKGKLAWSLLCVPVGFMLMKTPLLAILLIVQMALAFQGFGIKKCAYWLLPAIVLGVTPLAYSEQVAFIPVEQRYTDWGTYFDPLWGRYNRNGEYIKKMAYLASEGRWEELLYKAHAKTEARKGNAVALRYALLAESALGTLPENLLDYPISDENLFLFPHKTEYVALQFNRLFYLNLGIYDEAYHHAQEYGLLQPSGICFSSIRQMIDSSIEEGDFEIAEKFLHILSKSSCHKKFVKERRERIQNSKSINSKSIPLRADNFVGGFPLPIEMLRLARYYQDSPHRGKMVDYALCSYLIRGDRQSFLIALQAFDFYKDKPLPKAYSLFLNSK